MKQEINYAKKMKNPTKTWRLHNMLLNNQWINDQIKTKIKQYMETNDNNNSRLQNLWDAAKAVLRGQYIAIQAYLRKEQSQMNSLNTINETRKGRTKDSQSQWKDGHNKD